MLVSSGNGRYHDLDAVLRRLCRKYFPDCAAVDIAWGRWSGRRQPRSMRFGVYLPHRRLIRIHPALDQPFVPGYFVEFIVYHELLHHVIPPVRIDGRYHIHTAAFRDRERAFPGYAQASAWRKRHLQQLLAPWDNRSHPTQGDVP